MKRILIILFASMSIQVHANNIENVDKENLMKGFWHCHKISDETERAGKSSFPNEYLDICTKISKEVQKRYFTDDFALMHDWTVKNYNSRPLVIK